MNSIWRDNSVFERVEYEDEVDLGSAILEVQELLFGRARIYVSAPPEHRGNTPDGYLLDLSWRTPRLYLVEHEVRRSKGIRGPSFRSLGYKFLNYFQSYSSPWYRAAWKTILAQGCHARPEAGDRCAVYAAKYGFESADHLLEHVVNERLSAAVIIIDEPELAHEVRNFEKLVANTNPDDHVLARWVHFPVEVLRLTRFENQEGEHLYFFDPFLKGVEDSPGGSTFVTQRSALDLEEIDTVVVQNLFYCRTFLQAIRTDEGPSGGIHALLRPHIKYIANLNPSSAITHIAPIRIELDEKQGEWVIHASEKLHEIGPIPLAPNGRVGPWSGLRYTSKARLDEATTLDDVW